MKMEIATTIPNFIIVVLELSLDLSYEVDICSLLLKKNFSNHKSIHSAYLIGPWSFWIQHI